MTVPDPALAALFYTTGLGLTRDPYMDFGTANMWINAGSQQFHLPTQTAQVLRGCTGLVVPDLLALEKRLTRLDKYFAEQLQNTEFSWLKNRNGQLSITCPWGNRFSVSERESPEHFNLGISWIEIDVTAGSAPAIARFYSEIMEAPARFENGSAIVNIGRQQTLRFKESEAALPEYDGHHIAIYMANFSRPYHRLLERGLISKETNEHEYRFQSITNLDTGQEVATIEHEVRSTFHPMYARELVNRNAQQSFFTYQAGADAHQALNHSGSL